MIFLLLVLSFTSGAANLAWSSAAVRAALLRGDGLANLTEALVDLPPGERSKALIDAIDLRFPKGSRLILFELPPEGLFNLNYQERIASQVRLLWMAHGDSNLILFDPNQTRDLWGNDDRLSSWQVQRARFVKHYFTENLVMPGRLTDFTAPHHRWDADVISSYPTAWQVALLTIGGPRAAFYMGFTGQVLAGQSEAVAEFGWGTIAGIDDPGRRALIHLVTSANAMLMVEETLRREKTARTALLPVEVGWDIQERFKLLTNVEFDVIDASQAHAVRRGCQRQLELSKRARAPWWKFWGA